MERSDIKITTINDIHDAIDVLLTAYISQLKRRVGTKVIDKRLWRLSDYPADSEAELMEMVTDPLRTVYRHGIRQLGQFLHDRILTEYGVPNALPEMHSSLLQIAERDPEDIAWRASILDKIWDGIGNGDNIWMA